MKTGETVWDARLEGLFGLSPGEFDGTFDTYVSMLHPDDRQRLLDALTRVVESKSTYRVEHRAIWPDGSVHWIAGVGGVTLDERNEVTGTVGCSMDVTERMEQELERQRLADVAMLAATNERLLRERLEFLGIINDALERVVDGSRSDAQRDDDGGSASRGLVQHSCITGRWQVDAGHRGRPRRSGDGRLRP